MAMSKRGHHDSPASSETLRGKVHDRTEAIHEKAAQPTTVHGHPMQMGDIFKFVGLIAFLAIMGLLVYLLWPYFHELFEPGGLERVIGDVRAAGPVGFLILLGITHEDTEAQAVKLADKLVGLRIFEDEDGKMNRGLETVGGEILVVSQFTLYGAILCKGAAARPEAAIPLYEKFVALCREKGFHTETGEFGADMLVHSVNDGPLTLIVDTDQLSS